MNDSPLAPRAVLDIAAEVERDEANIKAAILDAANAGDSAQVVEIMARWSTLPASQVLPIRTREKNCPKRADKP